MKHTLLLSLSLSFAFALGAAETIYPTLKPGANPAIVPTPRSEWHATVQKKFSLFGDKHFDIVFDGDSITNRWQTTGREEWTKRYAGLAADFGIEGDLVENVLWRLGKGQVDGIDPKLVVLMIGTNNVSRRNTPDQIAEGIKLLVTEYKQRCPNAHIALMGVFPRSKNPTDDLRKAVNAINTQIASLADGKRVTFVDIGAKLTNPDGSISPEMMPDFLHPAAPGYSIWAEALAPLVAKYVPSAATASSPPVSSSTPQPGSSKAVTITFSGLHQERPEQRSIPESYQPLSAPIADTNPEDGGALGVDITWDNAGTSTKAVNPGVRDHTPDKNATDQRGGGVMFGVDPFGMAFSKPVEIPSLYWTFYGPASAPDSPAKIEVFTAQNPEVPAKTATLEYPDATGYVWHQETGFAGMAVTKIKFYPATKGGNAVPLNVDDIQVAPAATGK